MTKNQERKEQQKAVRALHRFLNIARRNDVSGTARAFRALVERFRAMIPESRLANVAGIVGAEKLAVYEIVQWLLCSPQDSRLIRGQRVHVGIGLRYSQFQDIEKKVGYCRNIGLTRIAMRDHI